MREPWVATLLPPQLEIPLEAPAPRSKAPCEHRRPQPAQGALVGFHPSIKHPDLSRMSQVCMWGLVVTTLGVEVSVA